MVFTFCFRMHPMEGSSVSACRVALSVYWQQSPSSQSHFILKQHLFLLIKGWALPTVLECRSGGLSAGLSHASKVEIPLSISQPSCELRLQHSVTLSAWAALPLWRALQLCVSCKVNYPMQALQHFWTFL